MPERERMRRHRREEDPVTNENDFAVGVIAGFILGLLVLVTLAWAVCT